MTAEGREESRVAAADRAALQRLANAGRPRQVLWKTVLKRPEAGALGGASSLFLLPADDDIRVASTVQLDPLLFGPSELGF